MGESGKVTKIEDEYVVVSLKRVEACAKCRACIAGMKQEEMIIRAKNICGAEINDYVEIELHNGFLLKAAVFMYGIQSLAFFLGIGTGYLILKIFAKSIMNFLNITDSSYAFNDIFAFFCGIIFVALSYLIIKRNNNKFNQGGYVPMATKIVDPKNL